MADSFSFLLPILNDLVSGRSSWKLPVKVVATTNVTQTGTQTIDDVALAADDEVLCVGQTATAQNGIWVVKSGAWVRRADAFTNTIYNELYAGARVPVQQGTAGAGDVYRLTTTGLIRIGITAQAWEIDAQGSAGVTDVAGTAPIAVTGTTTKTVAITAASAIAAGSQSATHFSLLNDSGPGDVDDVAGSLSNRIVARDSNGDAAFNALSVGQRIDVGDAGDGGTYLRIKNTAPTAVRELTTGSDGRVRVFVDGVAASVPVAADVYPTVQFQKMTADTLANAITAPIAISGPLPYEAAIDSAYFIPDASGTLTADDTDYATLNVYEYTGATPTGVAQAATTTTDTGNWTAWNPVSLTVSGTIPAGSVIAFGISKSGAGVPVPRGTLVVTYARI